jgi:hypothetical protein
MQAHVTSLSEVTGHLEANLSQLQKSAFWKVAFWPNPSFRKAVPVQVVDATPSELEAFLTGGVYDPKKT